MPKRKKPTCYGVARGRETGVFNTWSECEARVKGFTGARFRGFSSVEEAKAFVSNGGRESNPGVEHQLPVAKKPKYEPQQQKLHGGSPDDNATAGNGLLRVSVQFDGGSRGNPGNAGSGAALTLLQLNGERKVWHIRHHLRSVATNNEAEYTGVIIGLQTIVDEIPYEKGLQLIIQGDSKLVVKQLQKEWKVKKDTLKPYFQQAITLMEKINASKTTIEHVYRENNKLADELANAAMDARRSWKTSSDDNHEEQVEFTLPDPSPQKLPFRQLKLGMLLSESAEK